MDKVTCQIFDVDYVMANGKPIVRIFGKQKDGKTICLMFNGFLPYFYLYSVKEENYERAKKALQSAFPYLKFEIVERYLPIGYGSKKKVLKIIGADPSKIPDIRAQAEAFGTAYEADVLFKYRFMADYHLRGMTWIEAEVKPFKTETVKCQSYEAVSFKNIDVQENAPLKYLSLDIECISDEDRVPDPKNDPIIIISLAFYPKYRDKDQIILIAKKAGLKNERVMECENEEDMLQKFIDIVNTYDPDIIVGYNINNFDAPYIIERMDVLGLPKDFGRSSKSVLMRKLQQTSMTTIIGRVIADPYEILKSDPVIRFKRYDLNTIAKALLNDTKIDIGGAREIKQLWESDIKKLIEYAGKDAVLALRLVTEKHLLDKYLELAKISGLLLQDTFGGQTQRHEFNILSEFVKDGFIMPCKPKVPHTGDAELKGAIVFEPEVGLHNEGCTLVLDFTSLYPSLIITFNICPTTLLLEDSVQDYYEAPNKAKFVKQELREGIIPRILKRLIDARAKIKKAMKSTKDEETLRLLDAQQNALKIMANSMYGYMGYGRSRLFVMPIANAITAYGRENIQKTKKLVEDKYPVKVIYGDTDSVFVKTKITDLDAAEQLGEEIADFVSDNLPGVLNLKFEKIFRSFLILSKKRYAGWSFEKVDGKWKDKIVMKGIETVRRDWCDLVGKTMKEVLSTILKEADIQKAAKQFRNVAQGLAEGKVPLEDLTVVKGITKPLSAYDGVQPHVELAKKILERNPAFGNIVGARIGYVIIKGNALISKRAEDPEYVKKYNLEIDADYYIQNQLLPPIERIFEVCGISAAELLEGSKQKSLLDMFKKKEPAQKTADILDGFDSIMCKSCGWQGARPPLTGRCPNCASELLFERGGAFAKMIKISK